MPEEIPAAAPSPQDRRQEERHAVEHACRLIPESAPLEPVTGVTANVSHSGILIRFPETKVGDVLPKVGEQVRVLIDLPPKGTCPSSVLDCVARVVRAEDPRPGAPSLAFEVLQMQIRDSAEPLEGDAQRCIRMGR